MKSKCIKNNMTNNNQLFFLFKIMTYNSHLFFCVWKHDKLGGGCLVFTSFYGSSNNKSWTSIYIYIYPQKKIESSQERPFAQWDQAFFKLFAPLLRRKKNYSLCELPSSLSCCEPLHLLLINLSCSFSFSLTFYVHRHQHTLTHVYVFFFTHKYAHTYHICTYTYMYNIFVHTLLPKLLLPCKS